MPASGLKTCTIWAPSMSLASASLKSDGQSTSKQDSKSDFWPLLRMPCLDRDGGQSAFSTSNRRWLFPSLTCIVMYSCFSKCMSSLVLPTCLLLLRLLCRLPGRWILFILIGAWNATDVDCRRCATKSSCCFFPSPCAPMILRATLSISIPQAFMATKLPSLDLVGNQAIVSPICRHIIAFIDESIRDHLGWLF